MGGGRPLGGFRDGLPRRVGEFVVFISGVSRLRSPSVISEFYIEETSRKAPKRK